MQTLYLAANPMEATGHDDCATIWSILLRSRRLAARPTRCADLRSAWNGRLKTGPRGEWDQFTLLDGFQLLSMVHPLNGSLYTF